MANKKQVSTVTQPLSMPADNAMVSPGVCEQMIAVAAYYLAEQRGFSPGQEIDDWLRAEKEIASRGGSGT